MTTDRPTGPPRHTPPTWPPATPEAPPPPPPASTVLGASTPPRGPLRERLGVLVALAVVVSLVVGAAAVLAGGVGRPPPTELATSVDPTAAATGAVLDRWWGVELAALDLRWVPVGARLTDGDGSLACDGAAITLDESLRRNAFAQWCPEGPTIAFDPERFAPDVVSTQVVLAHEWGHLVQFANPAIDLPTNDPSSSPAERELQADCFAGAWAAAHVVSEFHGLMLSNIGSFGDPSWVPLDHEDGHGTPSERAAAYETGVAAGVAGCLAPAFDPR